MWIRTSAEYGSKPVLVLDQDRKIGLDQEQNFNGFLFKYKFNNTF